MTERFFALVPHPTQMQVLLVPTVHGWCLPEVVLSEIDQGTPAPNLIVACLHENFGLDTVLLGSARVFEPVVANAMTIYSTERAGTQWHPPMGAAWMGSAELSTAVVDFPSHRAAIDAHIAVAAGQSIPNLGLPWWGEGWLARATEWALSETVTIGYTPSGAVEQIKSGYTASVLEIPVIGGSLYMKAVPKHFPQEISLTQALKQMEHQRNPTVLASSRSDQWMLLADIGGQSLGDVKEISSWKDVVRAYAQHQIKTVDHRAQWKSMAIPDLTLSELGRSLPEALSGLPERLLGLPQTLTVTEMVAVLDRIPKLQTLCYALADFALPDVLEHGDLHAGNIRLTESGPIFYDWSHACLTHPFFCMGDLLADDDWFPDVPNADDQLRDAYLEPWTDFLSIERLCEAFQLSERIYRLYIVLERIRFLHALQGQLSTQQYIPETPTGSVLRELQWWLAADVRKLLTAE